MKAIIRSSRPLTAGYLLVLFVLGCSWPAAGQNLAIWDGESGYSGAYGALSETQPYKGQYCFEAAPDAYHQPRISLSGQPAWRANLSAFDELWFYVRCDQPGKTFLFSVSGYPKVSNAVSVDDYIAGGVLDTTYRLVRIPLSALKTDAYSLDKVEELRFGVASPTVGHKLYVDEVWAMRVQSQDPVSEPIVGALEAADFGDVLLGASADRTVRVTNVGTAALAVSGVSVTGADSAEFTAAPDGFTLDPGQSHDILVTFTPAQAGRKSASLAIAHNSTPTGTVSTAPLQGRGTAPKIALSTTLLDFGTVPVGQSLSWKLTVTNTGTHDLTVASVSCRNNVFTAAPASFSLSPGASTDVVVSCAPAAEETVACELTVASDDPVTPEARVELEVTGAVSGTGTALACQVDQVTSSAVALSWPQAPGAASVRVLVGPEPPAAPGGNLPVSLEVATLPGDAQSYRVAGLAAAVDAFVRVEALDAQGAVLAAGVAHARTLGGPRAALDTPLREVHLMGPRVLQVVLENKRVESYMGADGALKGCTGEEWQAGPWSVTRRDGRALAVTAVHRHSVPVGQPYYELGWGGGSGGNLVDVDHRIYLVLDAAVGQAEVLRVQGPQGLAFVLPYSDRYLETPVVQLNQVGYSPRATQRWAYVSGWLGDGGPLALSDFPGTVEVLEEPKSAFEARRTIVPGVALGPRASQDADAGTDVREIDLSGVPGAEGVVYRVRVPGVGVSWPTQVSETAVFKAFYTMVRGLYHNRWGRDLRPECTEWTRPPDHPTVYTAERAWEEGFHPDSTPKTGERPMVGGHHDAGDFDLRVFHNVIPLLLMRAYQVNPGAFADGQLNIPESGNGIPDILDEALWNLAGWEQLQEEDGGVRAGAESSRHPYGIYYADQDPLPYWTYARDAIHTARVAGLFAEASRLVAPFDAARAARLQERAARAYAYAMAHGVTADTRGPAIFAAGEMFRLTGGATYKDMFEGVWTYWNKYGNGALDVLYPYTPDPGSYYGGGTQSLIAEHLLGYLNAPDANSAYRSLAVKRFATEALTAVNAVDALHAHRNARPVGMSPDWARGTAVGEYMMRVYAHLALNGLKPDEDEDLYNALSISADYALGANPLGMVWVTGLGSRRPEEPLHLDSLAFMKDGKGPIPGIPVFGPVISLPGAGYYDYGENTFYPAFKQHPLMLRYGDIRTFVTCSETSTGTGARHVALLALLVAPGMKPPASWLPGGKEHRNPLAPRDSAIAPTQEETQTDTTPPRAGGLVAPAVATSSPITVTFTGAGDAGSGIKEVRLWAKKGAAGAWEDTGLAVPAESGAFTYAGATGDSTYFFALRAEDNAGNFSAIPAGVGEACTLLDTTPPSPGVLSSPPLTNGDSVEIEYHGVHDAGSGPKEVRLWVKRGRTGAWQDTGLRSRLPEGEFTFSRDGADGLCYFCIQAVDNAGLASPEPDDELVFGGG